MDANEQVTQVIAGELPPEGRRGLVVTLLEVSEALLDLGQVGEIVGRHDLRCTTEKKTSIWFNQEACLGVCTITALGNRAANRSIAAWPRWEDPLSTTQNTRLAEAYGSHVMTCSTNVINSTSPVEGAHRPNTRACLTS